MTQRISRPPWYSDAEVAASLNDQQLLRDLTEALIELSSGRVQQPLRSVLPLSNFFLQGLDAGETGAMRDRVVTKAASAQEHGSLFIKPVQWRDRVAVKLVTLIPSNAAVGLPGLLSLVVLMDARDGRTLAIMEGNELTARRTAAVSAIAADRFASRDRCVLGLIGSGVLARAHARLLARVRELSDIRVWSPTPEHARACAEAIGGRAVESAEAAASNADIVCTLTHAREPVLFGRWLKPGAFVAAVGAPRPTWRELDDEVMRHPIVVDQREAAMNESGDLILSRARIHAELGEVLAGKVAAPARGQTVVFKSLGLALEDAVAATLVLPPTEQGALPAR
jgi:thiomorpholine-carboxylate dehydrogenase